MSRFEIGVTLPIYQYGEKRTTPRWADIKRVAVSAEQMGMDTLWIPDELLWSSNTPAPQGFWDGYSMAGAAAAVTSKIKIGSWVFSALHRNPAVIAKAAETLDEISGGRFVFGLGAGHAGIQAHIFGLPEDAVFARWEEALRIIVPLMRGGRATFEGKYHSARDLVQQPVGPRPNRIPLLIGGQKTKAMRLAAVHADVWSTFAEEKATLDEMGPRMTEFLALCDEVDRDPATMGKAAGVEVRPLAKTGEVTSAICGSTQEIADGLRAFREAGFTQADLMVSPGSVEAFDALAPVVEMLAAD